MAGVTARVQRLRGSISAWLFYPMARRVRRRGLTYLSNARLISLSKLAAGLARRREMPLFVEFGVALGGSSILLADILRRAGRGKLIGYDMFGLIPEPSKNDSEDAHLRYATIATGKSKGLKGQTYYGYETDLQAKVAKSFEAFGLDPGKHYELFAGDFRESFTDTGHEIDLMHIDCDWHDSVMFCLEKARQHLSRGGFIVVDDYHDYEGCRQAVDKFLAVNAGDFEMILTSPHAVLQRLGQQAR
jgi:O-methyltransferase